MRPNILWICTDQQRYDTIGALNNRQLRSPNIDRLVASDKLEQPARSRAGRF